MQQIQSLELENYLLSGILSHPNSFAEIDGLITEADFVSPLHQTIFGVIRQTLHDQEPLDKILIAEKIERYSLSFDDKISSVLDYLNSITLNQIKASAIKSTAKELKSFSLRRYIADVSLQNYNQMVRTTESNPDKIVAESDHIYGKIINAFVPENEPVDLFEGTESYIKSLDNDTPNEEIICPYPIYQTFFGGYFPGDLVIFASPPKSGKSTLLLDMLVKMCQNKDDNVSGLIIDTELETYRVQRRMVSALSGVNEYLIKSKRWRHNEELSAKISQALKQIKTYFNRIDHIYVGNVSTEQMTSIVRRWTWKKRIQANKEKKQVKLIAAIDYFKLTGVDAVNDAFAASMNLGYRVDTFKKLASELQIPIIGACQTNRMNEVGLSHEINKFVSSLFLFQRKTPEELARDGYEARHKLVPLYTRDLGEYSQGVNDLVKVHQGGKETYVSNYIAFKVENFVVSELHDLKGVHRDVGQVDITQKPKEDDFDGFLS